MKTKMIFTLLILTFTSCGPHQNKESKLGNLSLSTSRNTSSLSFANYHTEKETQNGGGDFVGNGGDDALLYTYAKNGSTAVTDHHYLINWRDITLIKNEEKRMNVCLYFYSYLFESFSIIYELSADYKDEEKKVIYFYFPTSESLKDVRDPSNIYYNAVADRNISALCEENAFQLGKIVAGNKEFIGANFANNPLKSGEKKPLIVIDPDKWLLNLSKESIVCRETDDVKACLIDVKRAIAVHEYLTAVWSLEFYDNYHLSALFIRKYLKDI